MDQKKRVYFRASLVLGVIILMNACGASNWEKWLERYDMNHMSAIEDYAEASLADMDTDKASSDLRSLRQKAMNIYFDLKIVDEEQAETFLDSFFDIWVMHGTNIIGGFKQKLSKGIYDEELAMKMRAFNEDYEALKNVLEDYNQEKVTELESLYKSRLEESL